MTTNIIILLAILAVIVVVTVLFFFKFKGSRKEEPEQAVSFPSSESKSAIRPEVKTELDSLIEVLKTAAGENDHVYCNRYIPVASGKVSCVQAMILGTKGMVLFRFLPLEGWILGNKDSRWWTFFVSTDERAYINNPIWECKDLVNTFEIFLPSTFDADYHLGVVFSNKCELRSVEAEEGIYTGNLRQLMRDFKEMYDALDVIYEPETIEKLAVVLDVMDDPETAADRLKALKRSMTEKRDAMIRMEAGRNNELEVTGDILSALTPEERQELRESRHIKKYRPEERFTRSEIALREGLVIWRKQEADARNISVVEIFDNRVLDNIVNLKPLSLEALKKINGFDDEKIQQYGKTIVTMVKHAPIETAD